MQEPFTLSKNTVNIWGGLREILTRTDSVNKSLKAILDAIDDAIVFIDKDSNIIFLNLSAELKFGKLENTRLLDSPLQGLPLSRLMAGEEIKETKILVTNEKSSEGIWIEVTGKPLRDANGCFQGSAIFCRDTGNSERIEEQSLKDIHLDKLTGLPNRDWLLEKLKSSITLLKKRKDRSFALLFIDVDRFKAINDSLGHIMGDCLLKAIARRLRNCLRCEDSIVRLNGDEFVILLEKARNVSTAEQVAERIYNELMHPFLLEEHEVFVDVSIGIAMGNESYKQPEEVLRDAHTAMHHAKGLGKACYQVFNPDMRARVVTLLQLENSLRRAIKRQEFQLHYQPIVSLQTQKIKGFEALVRWQKPERGTISPNEFIPLAEETGLIIPIDLWVLQEACTRMVLWQKKFTNASHWTISVNISGRHLSKPNFIEHIKQILNKTDFNPRQLKLEITETVLIKNTEFVIGLLKQLQEIGVQLSLDDFGTGYSSLSYLHQFSFDTLKVDRSFIHSMEKSNEKLGIVRTILSLAENLGMEVVAEGIETGSQLEQLKILKCQYGQGYLFSKPLDVNTTESLIVRELIKETNLSLNL